MEPIEIIKLTLNQPSWTLRVLLSEKEPIKKFKSGEGRILKTTLMDKDGSKIHAIMFNEIIDKFHDILHVGQTYLISNGHVKEINRSYYNVHEKYEIILNNLSEIHQCDMNFGPSNTLTTIENIKAKPNTPSDVLLLVKNVGELKTVFRKRDKKEIIKRDMHVIGFRSEVVVFTLWDSLATIEGEKLQEIIDQFPIILAKAIVGKIFNGFQLSTTMSSTIEISPDLSESEEIREWFMENKFESYTLKTEQDVFTDLSKINAIEHSSEKIQYYDIKVWIKGIKEGRNLWYLVKLEVEDKTSTAILTLFDNEAQHLFDISVDDLKKLKEKNTEEYYKVLSSISGREEIFSIKSQDKFYGNRSSRTLTVTARRDDLTFEAPKKKIKLEVE